MKILQLTLRIPYPPRDGGSIAMYNVARQLHERGHELTLVALNTKKHRQDPEVMADIARVHATDVDTTPQTGPAIQSYLFGQLPYNIKRFYSNQHAKKIAQVIQEEGPFDVVQMEGVYTALYMDVVRQETNAPVVLRAHNVEYEIWERYAEHEANIFRRHYFRHLARRGQRFEKRVLNRFDGVITISARDSASMRQLGFQGAIKSIPTGINLEEYHYDPKEEANPEHIGFLGSLDWLPNQQGLQWFIDEAFPLLRNKVPEAQLHVAGRNPPQHLKDMAVEGVTIHGEVEDAMTFMKQYPLLIIPLLSGSGLRIKLIEALAIQRAVVTTPIGAEGIPARHREHLMLAETPLGFAEELALLIRDHKLRKQVREKTRRFVAQHYDWNVLITQFEDFYRQLA